MKMSQLLSVYYLHNFENSSGCVDDMILQKLLPIMIVTVNVNSLSDFFSFIYIWYILRHDNFSRDHVSFNKLTVGEPS